MILSSADTDNIPQWEKELQQELQDYELVDDAGDVDDADIENEILQQIEQETNSVWSEGSDQSETTVKSKYSDQWKTKTNVFKLQLFSDNVRGLNEKSVLALIATGE